MAIFDKLDVTPRFTFSTIQFENETVNVLVISLLAVLVLSNIGSIIAKLIYFTRETRFNYNSWLRAFIFANSDDPIRIISWIRRKYVYREPEWKRNPQKFRALRLVLPLTARAVVLIFSIASIAITIPGEKNFEGCSSGDYAVKINVNNKVEPEIPQGVCVDIPMSSKRGTVRSTVSYCDCPISSSLDFTGSIIWAIHDIKLARLRTIIASRGELFGKASYVEWKELSPKLLTYRSSLHETVDEREVAEVAVQAISFRRDDCSVITGARSENKTAATRSFFVSLNCTFDAKKDIEEVSNFLKSKLVWTKTDKLQSRVEITDRSINADPKPVCPINITVTRPVVNILPLILLLLFWFITNVIVSLAVMKHGNALDAGFHIIKEALGHDTTSNPFEEARDRQEIMTVERHTWQCSGTGSSTTGGHVGFIGRHGDIPVSEFGKDITVGECSRAAAELARAKAKLGQTVPGSPDDSQVVASLLGDPPGSLAQDRNVHLLTPQDTSAPGAVYNGGFVGSVPSDSAPGAGYAPDAGQVSSSLGTGYGGAPPGAGYSGVSQDAGYGGIPPGVGYTGSLPPPDAGTGGNPPSVGYDGNPPGFGHDGSPYGVGSDGSPLGFGHNEIPPGAGYGGNAQGYGYSGNPPDYGYNGNPPGAGYGGGQ